MKKRILITEDNVVNRFVKRARLSNAQRYRTFAGLRQCSDSLVSIVPKDVVECVLPFVQSRGVGRSCSVINTLRAKPSFANEFKHVSALCFYSNSRCIVTNTEHCTVKILSLPDFETCDEYKAWMHPAGQFFRPMCVAVDKDDNIVIGDGGNSCLQVLREDFSFVRVIREIKATAICVDNEGNYVVVENRKHRVVVLSEIGQVVRTFLIWGVYSDASYDSIAVNLDGNLVVCTPFGYVRIMTSYGIVLSTHFGTSGYDRIAAIAVDSVDQVIACNYFNNSIHVLDESGHIFPLRTEEPIAPYLVAAGEDGKLLMFDKDRECILYISTH